MRYISALKTSKNFQRFVKLLPYLVLAPPTALLIMTIRFVRSDAELIKPLVIPFLLIIAASALGLALFRFTLNRQLSAEVIADEVGLKHLSPGRERLIIWSDITGARRFEVGRSAPTVKLFTSGKPYTFDPYLIPDDTGAPKLLFKPGRQMWLTSDGEIKPLSVELCAGWDIIARHRPELLSDLAQR